MKYAVLRLALLINQYYNYGSHNLVITELFLKGQFLCFTDLLSDTDTLFEYMYEFNKQYKLLRRTISNVSIAKIHISYIICHI